MKKRMHDPAHAGDLSRTTTFSNGPCMEITLSAAFNPGMSKYLQLLIPHAQSFLSAPKDGWSASMDSILDITLWNGEVKACGQLLDDSHCVCTNDCRHLTVTAPVDALIPVIADHLQAWYSISLTAAASGEVCTSAGPIKEFSNKCIHCRRTDAA